MKKKELTDRQKLEIDVECGEVLNGMIGHPGWKLVEKYLNQRMADATTALLLSRSERDIFFNQAVVITIRQLFEKIGVSFREALTGQEIINKYNRRE